MRTFSFIKELFQKYPRLLAITTLLVVFVGVIEACSLFTVGPLIDFLVNSDSAQMSPFTHKVMAVMKFVGLPLTLGCYFFIFAIFVTLGSGFRILARRAILVTKYAVLRDLTIGTFGDFFNASWYFFSSSKQGVILNTFMRELTVVGNAFGAMAHFFARTIQVIFYLAVPLYISWQVTAISLATVVVFSLGCLLMITKRSYRLGQENTSTANEVVSVIGESFTLAKVILGFGNQKKRVNHLEQAFDAHREVTIKSQLFGILIGILYRPIGVIVLAVALFSARRFGVAVSEIAVLLLALVQIVLVVGDLVHRKHSLDNFFPSYEQVKRLRKKAEQFKQVTGGKQFRSFNKEMAIERVCFAYPGYDLVLRDINMRIPKGQMVAIVGESGAGKSTLIDIIMGFNKPLEGRISFDGINLQEFDINSYRKRIGYVPQESILFNMTIRDNLLWAREDATEEELIYACKQANADEFIKAFPQGYNTLVGDRGVRLSGGQRQRIALARAILRKPELLILDEATSSLDTHSERLIQRAVENISRETTIIVIAHRFSTIVNSDYVYVFKEGRVVEEGRYLELTQLDGHFNRMVKLQLLEVAR
ncbi:MAG: ABC transporter ATP-binding protein [Candidatus Omnitrophota bacterium]|nr:MAG: ABC transporter ATP-binding protein [Candidatus Omnitrophota bacterium]